MTPTPAHSSGFDPSSERELAMILDKSSDNIVVTDGDGVILKASSNFNRIYGLPISEAVGKTVQELQESGILTPSVTLEVLKRKREVQLMQSTSQGFQVMALGFPIFDEQGGIERVISFSRDLTDLQMLQQEYEQLQQRLLQPLLDTQQSEELAGLAFKSRPVREIIQLIRRIADTEVAVLFQGESGVGKTAFARLIHQLSDRKEKPFVEVNCSAIPENLFESEMFGYEAGAFSGASRQGKSGLIESAEGGT
ncbi:sigma 54-interacting transcriptional regulator, partial [Oceanospirillum sp. HFRX-1_2]